MHSPFDAAKTPENYTVLTRPVQARMLLSPDSSELYLTSVIADLP